MHITFYGATREVTGSMFLLSTDSDQILLDCGMFQGRRKDAEEKNTVLPFDPEILNNVILSHAHIDHSGRLPLLVKKGFKGRIITSRVTADACKFLLLDSAHIQESDSDYLNYKLVRSTLTSMKKSKKAKNISGHRLREIKALLKRGRHELNSDSINNFLKEFNLHAVKPLYSMKDANDTLEIIDGYPYKSPVTIGKNTTCTFYDAGHILGSSMNLVKIKGNGKPINILHSGDLGRFDKPIINDPTLHFNEEDRNIDLLLMESTYGNREHGPIVDLKSQLACVLNETLKNSGTVVIPAFAFGRTQTLLYLIHELYNENAVPKTPIYVDSPLATKLTGVFGEHPEVYDEEAHDNFLEKGINPFKFDYLRFIKNVEESMRINRKEGPMVVIAASGMCEAGRILHHLRHKIHNPKNTILLVGYMAQHTLGRRIEELGLAYKKNSRTGEPPLLRFMNKEYPLKANVVKIDGLSAHADKNEMLRFLKESNLLVKRIAVIHGEEEQSIPFAAALEREGFNVLVPRRGETVTVN
jgi:metallo-beta-lactamase family protein